MDVDKINKVFVRGNQGTIKLGPTVVADGFIEDDMSGESITISHGIDILESRIRKLGI